MRTLENPLVRAAAGTWFGLRRAYYQARYPRRLRMGSGVLLIGKLRIARGTRLELGDNCRIRQSVIVNGGGVAVVGAHTLLNGCWLGASERIEIGDWCLVSDASIADTDFHNLSPRERHAALSAKATSPVVVGRNVWIGARAIILKGTTIGADSVVGSGAVVRGAVPAGVVVAGNPAVVVKTFPDAERTVSEQGNSRVDVPSQRILPGGTPASGRMREAGRAGG